MDFFCENSQNEIEKQNVAFVNEEMYFWKRLSVKNTSVDVTNVPDLSNLIFGLRFFCHNFYLNTVNRPEKEKITIPVRLHYSKALNVSTQDSGYIHFYHKNDVLITAGKSNNDDNDNDDVNNDKNNNNNR